MDLFLFAADFSSEPSPQLGSIFSAAVEAFGANANPSLWQEKRHLFLLDRVHGHFAKSRAQSEQVSFFIGREFESVRADSEFKTLSLPGQLNFPFCFLDIDEPARAVRIESDALGLFSYFYTFDRERLVVSNYLPALVAHLDGQVTISTRSVTDLALFGTTSPGQTIYNEIHMSHPLENILFSQELGLQKIDKIALTPNANATSEEIYSVFRSSVQEILQTSTIHWFNITGGSDTRLILSTLSKEQREAATFVFDEVGANPAVVPWDRAIIRILEKELKLNVRYRFPNAPGNSTKGYFDRPDMFSAYPYLLSGMFGGESLGGNAHFCLPDPNIPEHHSDEIAEALRDREKTKSRYRGYLNTSSDLAFELNLFTNSFMSFMYDDIVWIHPYILLQKKMSPFIHTDFLSKIFAKDYALVENYKLYYEVYYKHAPAYLDLPFFSRMSALGFQRVRPLPQADHAMLLTPPPTSAASRLTLNAGGIKVDPERFAQRLDLLHRGLALSDVSL